MRLISDKQLDVKLTAMPSFVRNIHKILNICGGHIWYIWSDHELDRFGWTIIIVREVSEVLNYRKGALLQLCEMNNEHSVRKWIVSEKCNYFVQRLYCNFQESLAISQDIRVGVLIFKDENLIIVVWILLVGFKEICEKSKSKLLEEIRRFHRLSLCLGWEAIQCRYVTWVDIVFYNSWRFNFRRGRRN